ncbi:lipopolysaccharide biosynthesis protein [uncultured Christiangramia sp.]|uniref:lipopolysaccharide biosynthesis protein n=1 Tax=uncultured Christiangramia sp. TaxID=503836 RepID=UPI002608DC12|nr:lipopolysaccharide biosynthesis protein [uncultured Christiangramia sp.]
MSKLNQKIFSGVFWNLVQLIIQRSLSFVVKLILARLLFPEDFGIVGMAAVFISFIKVLNDVGIGAALIQKKEKDLNELHYYTAFWTGVVWSIILYLLIAFLIAPLASTFYGSPILEEIIPILSIGILSSPINLIHKAQLTKSMNFKRIAIITNSSNVFSGLLSVGLAFAGVGVWALVFNSVASFLVAIPMYFHATGWWPKFKWGKQEFKDIFGFGMYTTGTNLFNNIISQLDYLVIGKMLSASILGVYTLAFLLTDTFKSQLMNVMNKVMYPVYGQLQDNKNSIKEYYLKVVLYNSVLIYPIMVIMLILGKPIIAQFFGDKWMDAVIPLQILSVSVMFSLMVNSHTSLIRGMGKPEVEMRIQFFRAIFLYIPSIIAGTYYYGMIGTAAAVLFNKIAAVFVAQWILKKMVNISLNELFSALKAPILATIISAGTGYFLYNYLILHYLFVGLMIVITYFAIIYLLMKEDIHFLYNKLVVLKRKRKSNKKLVS